MMPIAQRIQHLIRPEEITWRTVNGPAGGGQPRGVSLKAVFWCAVAIVISLALGNLT